MLLKLGFVHCDGDACHVHTPFFWAAHAASTYPTDGAARKFKVAQYELAIYPIGCEISASAGQLAPTVEDAGCQARLSSRSTSAIACSSGIAWPSAQAACQVAA